MTIWKQYEEAVERADKHFAKKETIKKLKEIAAEESTEQDFANLSFELWKKEIDKEVVRIALKALKE